jgi:WD40 repeat protein
VFLNPFRRVARAGLGRLFLLAAMACGVCFTLISPAHAGEPPTAPILRIAPGAHTAAIRRIASDAAGRWLVTASDDKTAQVWDLASNRLLTTLRPPIGAGNEGRLNAVAMSPDGGTVAVAWWTGYELNNSNTIYLFGRANGRLQRRIAGLPSEILDLAYAPDGRTLAASLGGGEGIGLFNPANGQLLAYDDGYGDSSFNMHFSADGQRLVTASRDGHVRLYRWKGGRSQRTLSPLAKQAAPGGQEPYSVRFSPDGRRIAVGFADTEAVNVLHGENLSLLAAPDTVGVDGSLGRVTWSRDGAWLYAAGMAHQKIAGQLQVFIRRWPVNARGGVGAALDWHVSRNSLSDLAPLSDRRLAFSSGEPAWGVLDALGRRSLYHPPAVADLRDNHDGFTVSHDASQVRFGYGYEGESPAVFDSQSRRLLITNSTDLSTTLTAPRLTAPGLDISDWENTRSPKLNGQPLKLEPKETSRSLAVLPDASGFILGTEFALRAFDRNGKDIWRVVGPNSVDGVNVSRDGRWVVAAYADGTIRWHRASDGVEQLAFYPHPDQKRWVLWTPSGYFDASPGAEDLIGWHVNNGKDAAADFFPASRFRDRFYRPDVVAQVLTSGDEAEALRLANAESGRRTQQTSILQTLPPVARIVARGEGERFSATRQTLRYTVRTAADAPLTGVKVLVDGRPIEQRRGLQRVDAQSAGSEQTHTLEINLPERDVTLSLIAENKHGASVEHSVRLAWAGAKEPEFVAKPKLYLLAVGVSDYQDKSLKLAYPAKDARDFAAALQKQKGLYQEVVVKLLPDATTEQILDGLDWLRGEVTAKDVGVLFLAGHGVNDADGDYYFLPANANPERLRRTAVAYFDVKKTLSSLPGKTLAFIDTCHSGNVMGARRGVADINRIVNDLTAAENGVVVFASSTGRQYSLENSEWNNGAFTKALVEGLNGKADYTKDGAITINELDTWVADRVKQLTKNQQTPTTTKPNTVPDFPVAAVR